jgi:hypothetical protein
MYGKRSQTPTLQAGRVGHPEVQRPGNCRGQCLVNNVQKWYYLAGDKMSIEKVSKGCAIRHANATAEYQHNLAPVVLTTSTRSTYVPNQYHASAMDWKGYIDKEYRTGDR